MWKVQSSLWFRAEPAVKEGGQAGATPPHISVDGKSPFPPDFPGCQESAFVRVEGKDVLYNSLLA